MENILTISDSDEVIHYQKSSLSSSYSYKPTLGEVFKIYRENPDSIFMYDTSQCITVITDDGRDLPLNAYKHGTDILSFIKITTPALFESDNEILIDCNGCSKVSDNLQLLMTDGISWYSDSGIACFRNGFPDKPMGPVEIRTALTDYNGYRNCIAFMSENSDKHKAVNTCMQIVKKTSAHLYQAYIPAMGQADLIFRCRKIIKHILKYTGNTDIELNSYRWTSTCLYPNKPWMCSEGYGQFYQTMGIHKNQVFPIYKQIK